LRPDVDVPIVFTGLRPGEKLREELALRSELAAPTPHPKIRRLMAAGAKAAELSEVQAEIDRLRDIARIGTSEAIRRHVLGLVRRLDGYGEDREVVAALLRIGSRPPSAQNEGRLVPWLPGAVDERPSVSQ
jgi:FlaA1/EpsC-like NDP-sugar epimerase